MLLIINIHFQASVEHGENNIICVFMDDVKKMKLSGTLKLIINTVHCLHWPGFKNKHKPAQKLFWLQLKKAILQGADDKNEEDPNQPNGLTLRNTNFQFV